MLFSLPPPMDTASASAILSDLRWGSAAVHWTMPTNYLSSDRLLDPTIRMKEPPARSLTENEERLIWTALFASGEVLYSL
jgi:hypothetical protein